MAKAQLVDVHVGSRMRQRRTLLGMSQSKVGEAVGLTFQQIQKYERGSNRIGSSRLYEFAKVLDVPVSTSSTRCLPTRCRAGRCRAVAVATSHTRAVPSSDAVCPLAIGRVHRNVHQELMSTQNGQLFAARRFPRGAPSCRPTPPAPAFHPAAIPTDRE